MRSPEELLNVKYKDLTPEEHAEICNGCGGKGGWIKPPNFLFEADCNMHDFGYFRGGDEVRRMECDTKFLQAMLRDCLRVNGTFRRNFYKFWAYTYFVAVRIFGKRYFNYRKAK